MDSLRIVHVIDDDAGIQDAVALLLEAAGYKPVSHCSGRAFLDVVDHQPLGAILLDIHMPEISGLEVQGLLNERHVNWPVVVLTGQGDIGIAVQAMKNGAFEFLEKPYQTDALLGTLQRAFEKLEAVSEEAATASEARAMVGSLTPREREVMQGLLAGLPNKLIAYELDISTRTVEIYRANVMDKLNARGLSSAVRVALAAGLEPMIERR